MTFLPTVAGIVPTIAGIVLIDLVLSGDNTLVIGVAARRLPPRQRRTAIVAGGATAIALRVLFTVLAALLLRIPFLHLVGGVVLLVVAVQVLQEAGEAEEGARAAPRGLWEAIGTIIVADAAMSLDNVLGVAAAARDDLGLLVLGLALSMGMMILAGNAIADILNRYPWLVFAGSAVIAWTGASMALRDPTLLDAPALRAALPWLELAVPALATGAALLLGYRRRRRPDGAARPESGADGPPDHAAGAACPAA